MSENDWLAARFEQNRPHLQAVAYRMLGSAADADDAVQEAWMRLSRSGADDVTNLAGWLTTTVARVCLDMLRARKARREEPLPAQPAADGDGAIGADPEQEALLADSVGLALLVVLDTLSPAERAAFVLRDMFDLPFGDIAAIVGRTPNAVRLLASRARRRVRGADPNPGADLARQRAVANAFLAAARRGDFSAIIEVLDPQVVLRADAAAAPAGAAREVHGAHLVAKGALAFAARARFAQTALVNGSAGVVVAPPRPAIRSPRVQLRRRENLRDRCDRRPRAAPATRPCGPRQLTSGAHYAPAAGPRRGRLRAPRTRYIVILGRLEKSLRHGGLVANTSG